MAPLAKTMALCCVVLAASTTILAAPDSTAAVPRRVYDRHFESDPMVEPPKKQKHRKQQHRLPPRGNATSPLRELQRHQSAHQMMQDEDKGDFASSYSSGRDQFGDQRKISYTDKIRQLNAKLKDPFYASTTFYSGAISAGDVLGISCDFEGPCAWQWNATGGFEVLSGEDVLAANASRGHRLRGPTQDADNSTQGGLSSSPLFCALFRGRGWEGNGAPTQNRISHIVFRRDRYFSDAT